MNTPWGDVYKTQAIFFGGLLVSYLMAVVTGLVILMTGT